jgi:hypothetical protein
MQLLLKTYPASAASEGKEAPWSGIFGFFFGLVLSIFESSDNIFLKKRHLYFLFWQEIYELSTQVSVYLDFWMCQVLRTKMCEPFCM